MLRALSLTAALIAALSLATPTIAQTTPAPHTTAPTGRGTSAATPPAAPVKPTVAAPAVAVPAAPAKPTTAPAAAASPAATPASSTKRIDINAASEKDLAALPGIGPATAKNIVQGRPWDDLKDLVAKKAMPQSVFDKNKDRFALANINTSSAADMARTLPGIGDKTAPKIVAARPYATQNDLVAKKVLTEKQFEKIKDVITY